VPAAAHNVTNFATFQDHETGATWRKLLIYRSQAFSPAAEYLVDFLALGLRFVNYLI
jgi:hypothetical protein